jgi:glycosyltransferase involved in cell wall biosynthesis
MKVSIITPFYKGRKYLGSYRDTISRNAAFLAEKNKKEGRDDSLEVIIINDSPEDSVNSFGETPFKNVRFLTNDRNRGIQYSRVRGLSEATGDYIIFLDQDDFLRKDAVYLFMREAEKNPGRVIISNALFETKGSNEPVYKTEKAKELVWDKKTYLTVGIQIISPGQCLIPKNLIPSFWKEHLISKNGADDYYLWILMLSMGIGAKYLDAPLYVHQANETNLSTDTEKTDVSSYEFIKILRGCSDVSSRDLDTLEKMLKYKAAFRKGKLMKKGLLSLRHPVLFFTNVHYKKITATYYGDRR